jgi:hypothetical protein
MRDTSRFLSIGAVGLSAALLLLLSACGEPAEEQQGPVAPPATEEAPPANMATETEEPAEGAATQQ